MIDLNLLQEDSSLREVEFLISELKNLNVNDRYKKIFQASDKERELISTAVWLLSLREKARTKFSQADSMFFNDLSLEQSSSEVIARHIASRFKSDWQVIDLTCGIASNALALANKCSKVLANDSNEEVLKLARLNARNLGLDDKMNFTALKAEDLIDSLSKKDFSLIPDLYKKVDAFFIDPARNREGETKTRSILNSSPNILEILPKLFEISKNVAIKISPAFDYREIRMIEGDPEIEVISEDNNCKVAMLWFGDLKKSRRSAACFKKRGSYFFSGNGFEEDVDIGSVNKYVYETDKAISKAGLVDELAINFSLKRIQTSSSFLTGDKSPAEMVSTLNKESVFFSLTPYEVIRVFNSSFKNLRKELREMGVERVEIKAKNHFLKPEEIYSKLKLKEGSDFTLLFYSLENNLKFIVLMKRLDY